MLSTGTGDFADNKLPLALFGGPLASLAISAESMKNLSNVITIAKPEIRIAAEFGWASRIEIGKLFGRERIAAVYQTRPEYVCVYRRQARWFIKLPRQAREERREKEGGKDLLERTWSSEMLRRSATSHFLDLIEDKIIKVRRTSVHLRCLRS